MSPSTTEMLIGVAVLTVINIFYKGLPPALFGGREFPPRVRTLLVAFGPALLAGLLVVELLGQGWHGFDATLLPGLGAVAVLRWRRVDPVLCLLAGIAVTVSVRALL